METVHPICIDPFLKEIILYHNSYSKEAKAQVDILIITVYACLEQP